jgi:hypothetical protein
MSDSCAANVYHQSRVNLLGKSEIEVTFAGEQKPPYQGGAWGALA